MRRSSWRILTILALVCGALAWHVTLLVQGHPGLIDLASLWRDDRPVSTGVTLGISAKVDPLPPSPRYSMLPIEEYAAIIERALFWPDRRPPAEEADEADEAEAPVAAASLDLTLRGIVVTPRWRIALVRPKDGGEIGLIEGEGHDGWTLAAIRHDSVTFSRESDRVTLLLDYKEAPPPQKASAPERQREPVRQRPEAAKAESSAPEKKPPLSTEHEAEIREQVRQLRASMEGLPPDPGMEQYIEMQIQELQEIQ